MGDAWFAPGNSPNPRYPEKALALHDRALAEAGKSREGREYPLIVELFCGPDDRTAFDSALPFIQKEYLLYSEYDAISWQKSRIEDLVRRTFLVGSPATLIPRIAALGALGINHLVFRPFRTEVSASVSTKSVTASPKRSSHTCGERRLLPNRQNRRRGYIAKTGANPRNSAWFC